MKVIYLQKTLKNLSIRKTKIVQLKKNKEDEDVNDNRNESSDQVEIKVDTFKISTEDRGEPQTAVESVTTSYAPKYFLYNQGDNEINDTTNIAFTRSEMNYCNDLK